MRVLSHCPLNVHGSLTSRFVCPPCQSYLSILGRRAKFSVKRGHEGTKESAQRREACRSPPRSAYETEKVCSGAPSHPRSLRTCPNTSRTLFLSARFDRPNRPWSLHNPFHSRRALYPRSDWLAATDSVDHCYVSVRTRALTSQGSHSWVMSIWFSIQLTYSPPFGGPLSMVSLPFRQLTIEEGTNNNLVCQNLYVRMSECPRSPTCSPLAHWLL